MRLLETIGVRAFGLGQRLEPIRNLSSFGASHFAIGNVGVLVGLACDCSLQVRARGPIGNPVAGSPTSR
jgi:hypothetical protein